MKLYELTSEYQTLLNMFDEDSEVPSEAITDTLESISAEIEVKADNIACLLKDIEGDINKIKVEEDRLAERRKKKQAAYDRLKEYLAAELLKSGQTSIETSRNKITFRKSESVELAVDESTFIEWAEGFRDDLLTYNRPKPNKTAIKAAIKGGAEIFGAQIIEKQNIQIK